MDDELSKFTILDVTLLPWVSHNDELKTYPSMRFTKKNYGIILFNALGCNF